MNWKHKRLFNADVVMVMQKRKENVFLIVQMVACLEIVLDQMNVLATKVIRWKQKISEFYLLN